MAVLMLAGGLNCDWSRLCFKRNTNLALVIRGAHETQTLTHPAWTPDGSQLYYLTAEGQGMSSWGGALWLVDADGKDAHQVLADTFCALAVSSDGREIALAVGPGGLEGGRLAAYHVTEGRLESLPATGHDIYRVLFSRTYPLKLYYSSRNLGVYRINLDGTGEEPVSHSEAEFLESAFADSVLLPWVHPEGRLAVDVGYASVPLWGSGTCDLVTIDRVAHDTTFLHANPYKYSSVYYPVWSPDGRDVAFGAAMDDGDPLMPQDGEIWILHDVLPGSD